MQNESPLKASIPAPLNIEEPRGAIHDRLGPRVDEFNQYPAIPNLLIGFLATLGLLPIIGHWFQSTTSTPSSTGGGWALVDAFSALALLSATILWILRRIQRNDRYIVFKLGIGKVCMGQMTSLRWDEITSLTRGEIMVGNKTTHEILPFLRLQNATGTVLGIGDRGVYILRKPVDRLEHLVEVIESHVQHHLYPELLARFNRGETLDFGPFTANRAGISLKGRTLPWQSILALRKDSVLEIQNGASTGRGETFLEILEVAQKHPLARFPLASIQNPTLLHFIHIALRAP